MILALSAAAKTDIGLLFTFVGIGVVVNALVGYIAVQVRGERQQNLDYRNSRSDLDA